MPGETVECLMALGERARFVRGNAYREIVHAYDHRRIDPAAAVDPAEGQASFAAARISSEQRDFVAGFAVTANVDVDGLGATLFCHGSPRSDTGSSTPLAAEMRLASMLGGVDERVIVCGHTHRQFDRTANGRRFVNAGSVSVPYEGRAGAYWALLGVELRRTESDLMPAIGEMRAGGFPGLDDVLVGSLIDPVDLGEISVLFEGQAVPGR